jgi:glutathione S-transferase
MKYASVEEGIRAKGLRLVLTAGVPGPWGEAAKAIFHVKQLAYLPVRQDAGKIDPELVRWTNQSGAPAAIYENERPRTGWAEILFLAERLASEPRLVPRDPAERAQMLGLCFEICGEQGLGWSRRLELMGRGPAQGAPEAGSMQWKYGIAEVGDVSVATQRCNEILGLLAAQLARSQASGGRYFMGSALTALDLYWAAFSNMLAPMPRERCPIPGAMAPIYAYVAPGANPIDSKLLAHRDFIFEQHLVLPMDF